MRKFKIVLQEKFIDQDGSLNPVVQWVNGLTLYAHVLPKTGREYYKYQTINNEIEEIFQIRYMKNITTAHRISFNCKVYEIISIINVANMNEYLHIQCKAVVG